MKKMITLCIAFFAISTWIIGQTPIPPKPNPERLVNDFAGILTAEQVQKLENKLVEVDNTTGIQLAVVIVKELVDVDKADYATELGRSWGVGRKINSGIVLLISMDKKAFIAPGYAMEGELPDITCSQLCYDYIVPGFKEGKYYEAIDLTTSKIMETVGIMSWQDRKKAREFKEAADKRDAQIAAQKRQDMWDKILGFLAILAAVALPILLVWLLIKWIKDIKKENTRRQTLLTYLTKSYLAVNETVESIANADIVTNAKSLYPVWAVKKAEGYVKAAKEDNQSIHDCYKLLMQYTKKKIPKGIPKTKELKDQSYEFNSFLYGEFITNINQYHNLITEDIKNAVSAEKLAKENALQRYNTVKENGTVAYNKYIQNGYKLAAFNKRVHEIEESLTSLFAQEQELGSNFDEEVDVQTNNLQHVIDDMNAFVSTKGQVAASLPSVTKRFALLFDHTTWDENVKLTLGNIASRYPASVWQSLQNTWDKLIAAREKNELRLGKITEKNSMEQQDFDQAKADLDAVNTYNQNVETTKATILGLDNVLAKAKNDFITLVNSLKSTCGDVKTTAVVYHTDVTEETKKNFSTLVTRIETNAKIVNQLFDDWVAHLENINKIKSKVSEVIAKANEEIAAAALKRKKKKEADDAAAKAKEEADNRNHYTPTVITNDNNSGGGFGGFGGGSFGGGGGGATW